MESKSVQAMDDETLVIHGKKIIIRSYILPHISKMSSAEVKALGGEEGLRRQQGFYVYRNKRLLVWGTWFRMMHQGDLSKLARIRVDIPNTLDELWTLDIKKSSAMPPAEVRKNLETIINQIAERSKRTWTFRGKKEIDDKEIHIWNRMKNSRGGFYYEINRDHPMAKQIFEQAPEARSMLDTLLKQIEISLPLNQLYVDLNNDERLINDHEQSEEDVIIALQSMLTAQMPKAAQLDFLSAIESTRPFNQHLGAIEKLKKEVSENA